MKIKQILKSGLFVSCQALEGNPMRDTQAITRMAMAAELGGACAIRANGVQDITSIKHSVSIPIIGIQKLRDSMGRTIITPHLEAAKEIVQAGADVVALDATFVPSDIRQDTRKLIDQIHQTLSRPVMADISSYEEAVAAAEAGADLISTTLSGYTPDRPVLEAERYTPDLSLLAQILREPSITVPIIAEGRFWRPEDVQRAFAIGVYGLVIGKAITNPMAITQYFSSFIKEEQ